MSRLQIDVAAEQRYLAICRDYYKRLLARADIIARERDGNSIQTGDLERAHYHLANRGKKAQWLLAAAGAAVGAGISGLAQSLLDGKLMPYVLVFSTLILFGAVVGYWALSE